MKTIKVWFISEKFTEFTNVTGHYLVDSNLYYIHQTFGERYYTTVINMREIERLTIKEETFNEVSS